MKNLSNALADLAERVKSANETVKVAERTTIEQSIEAGRLLCQAKEECRHGEWYPFLTRACIHERQAARLMQIAKSGIKSDTCLELGGVKAALAYIGKLALPKAGEVLFIARNGESNDLSAIIHPVKSHSFFDLTIVDHRGSSLSVLKSEVPVRGESLLIDGQFVNELWDCIDQSLDIPASERQFTIMPDWVLEDDCAFLAKEQSPESLSEISIAEAPLPISYIKATEALRHCLANFSQANYRAACWTVALVKERSKGWPMSPAMLGTYAKIASDPTLSDLARKADQLAEETHFA